jgi:hypothetical protein
MLRQRKDFIVWFVICFVFFANQTAFANYSRFQAGRHFLADKFRRTELYFGTDKPDGGKVTDEDWNKFLETEVTPRFPDGFTVLEGYGQYTDDSGKIVRETSKVLVLFYPKKMRETVNPRIEELRANYKKQFNQESVLRLDFTKSVEVSF